MPDRAVIAVIAAIAVTVFAGCASASEEQLDEAQPDIDDIALSSAIDIRAFGCKNEAIRGSGAFIEGGFVLTAAHVVAGAESITVRPALPDGANVMMARIVAIDPANDLALLAAPGIAVPRLSIGRASANDEGIAVVFRDQAGVAQPFTISRPVIVRIPDIYHRHTVSRDGYQVEIEIEPGDSGAVLVGPDGSADGVLYARSQESDERAWATSTSAVSSLIDEAKHVDRTTGVDPGACAR